MPKTLADDVKALATLAQDLRDENEKLEDEIKELENYAEEDSMLIRLTPKGFGAMVRGSQGKRARCGCNRPSPSRKG